MTIRNRELSQFSSFLFIEDSSQNIGIATETTPNISIGTTNATHKFTVLGSSKLDGNILVSGISTFTQLLDANGGATIDNIRIGLATDNEIDTSSGNLILDSAGGTVEVTDNLIVTGNVNITGISTFTSNVTLGDSNVDNVTFNARINSSVLPSTDGTLNLGGSSNKWNSIYANTYENFKLSDLPTTDEPTFGPGKILKVKSDNSGYELVNISDLNIYLLGGFGLSGDGTVYVGIGSNVDNKFRISGISTSKLFVGEKVKVFGITTSTDNILVENPITGPSNVTKVGITTIGSTYRYWIAQYNLRNGKVGIATHISPIAGIAMTTIDSFNNTDHISLTNLSRTDTNHGILVYRQIGITTNINDAKLIAILGPKELSSSISGITWKDFGVFDQTEWSSKGIVNEYGEDQFHFPNIATTGHQRGWAIDTITSIGQSSIALSGPYQTNSNSVVKVVHDNTYAFKNAIDFLVNEGQNSIELVSGTYITNKITIPKGFTLKGNGKNTIIKLQHFATDNTDGAGNFLPLDGNMVSLSEIISNNITIQDITFDGNSNNNILFDGESINYLVNLENISSSLIKGVDISNSPANGLYVYNSKRLSIENCAITDGSITDRYPFQPVTAQESESLRINDCLFENYPGPVDLSVTTVALVAGNIIRNCGTGLRVYAAGKITTSNNIILGPSDEYIPTPDLYDSDYNSVNINIQRGTTFNSPIFQYFEDGSPKNLSSSLVSIISAGIGTIVGNGTTNETLSNRFLNFNVITPNSGTFGREGGYIQLNLTSEQTATLGLTSSLGYDIIAKEFLSVPVGLSTNVGISTGSWNIIGAGATNYTVTLLETNDFPAISTGDVVKLVNHSTTPDLSAYELTVQTKLSGNRLRLIGFTTTSKTNGNQSGYISIRNIFTITKGRVGVT